jgi:nucleoside-diphosphate-sugar epimerase
MVGDEADRRDEHLPNAVLAQPLEFFEHVGAQPRLAGGARALKGERPPLDAGALGDDRALNLPSISVTVGEMIESLRRVAGDLALSAIEIRPEPEIERIVQTWPLYASAERAQALGFPVDRGLDDIVREYLADFSAEAAGRLTGSRVRG